MRVRDCCIPVTHRFLPKPDAGTDDTIPNDALEIKWEFDEDSRHYYVSFPDDQLWCPVGAIGDRVACWG